MAVSFDAASSTGPTDSDIVHTVGTSGSNPVLIGVACAQSADSSVSMTANGDAMDEVIVLDGTTYVGVITGLTGDITIGVTGMGARNMMAAISYYGVDQDNPIDIAGLKSGADTNLGNIDLTVSSEVNEIVMDVVTGLLGNLSPDFTADSGITVRIDDDNGSCGAGVSCPSIGIGERDGAASVLMGWSGGANTVGHTAFALQVASPERPRLERYYENPYVSEERGYPVLRDLSTGREIKPEEIEVDEWGRAEGPFLPTMKQYSTLVEKPSSFYIQSVQTNDRGRARIQSAKESALESLLSRLGGRSV